MIMTIIIIALYIEALQAENVQVLFSSTRRHIFC